MVGPTASGKSEAALQVAAAVGGEILSVDSMQVYRGMDIGTAKPSLEERARIPHHMLDLVEPEVDYTVAEFQAEARRVIAAASRPVVLVGGSGLHFRAVVDPLRFPPHDPALRAELEARPVTELRDELMGVDPSAAQHLDLDNPRRVVRAYEIYRLTGETPSLRARHPSHQAVGAYQPHLPFRAVGLDPGDDLPARAAARLAEMRRRGLLNEVRSLLGRMGRTASQAVGYRQLIPVAEGRLPEEVGFAAAERATLTLARRQRAFFRRDPRIRWLPWHPDPARRTAAVVELLVGGGR